MLALLAGGTARAQLLGGPTASTLRLWHKTQGYGQEHSHTAAGWRLSSSVLPGLLFSDGQLKFANSRDFGVNIGGGYRFFHRDPLHGSQRIFGVSGWYDGEESPLENYFNQTGFSIESLGDRVDFRLNGNFPTDGDQRTENTTVVDLSFAGNQLVQGGTRIFEIPISVVDYEVAVRLLDLDLWAYGGGYYLDGTGVDTHGYKVGTRGQATDDLILDLSVSDDDNFKTNVMFSVIWFPGRRTSVGNACPPSGLARRINEPVFRNNYVALDREVRAETQAVRDDDGNPFTFVHVDSSATAPGDGTFESPLASLGDVQANSQPGNVVLVHGGSSFDGQSVTLQDEQRLLGEGDDFAQTVTNSELGAIELPETAPGAGLLARPAINNAPGDAIVLDLGSDSSLTDPVEVSNFTIDGGTRALVTTSGVGNLEARRLDISNTSGDAVVLTPLVETLPGGSTRVRFRPTIDQVNFDSVGGDDLVLDASHAAPVGATVDEQVIVGDTTSVNGAGVGINLSNTSAAAGVFEYTYDGGATGDAGIRISGADAQGTVIIQDSSFTGGTGPGIELDNAASTYTVINSTITDTGGAAVAVNGGAANLNFTGRIDQSNNAPAIDVNSGHTGVLAFNEATAAAGVIGATGGTGLQFNNADGTYQFNDAVVLGGGDAGVDVTGGSSGTFTFAASSTITNPTGNAFVVDGSNPIITYQGSITDNAGRPVVIENNTGGTVLFTGTITGTDQGISIQNNAGVESRFAGLVDLNTAANDAITVNGNTTGDTQFDDLAIETTSGTGVDVTNEQRIALNNAVILSATGEAVHIELNDPATLSNVTLNNVSATTGANEALLLTGNNGMIKTMNVLIEDSDFTNDAPAAAAADIEANGLVQLNLTIRDNEFTNNDAATGRPIEITADDPNATIRLDLNGNTAASGNAGDDYFLEQIQGTFNIVDEPNVDANNTGVVNQTGTFGNDPGPVPTP